MCACVRVLEEVSKVDTMLEKLVLAVAQCSSGDKAEAAAEQAEPTRCWPGTHSILGKGAVWPCLGPSRRRRRRRRPASPCLVSCSLA